MDSGSVNMDLVPYERSSLKDIRADHGINLSFPAGVGYVIREPIEAGVPHNYLGLMQCS